MSVPLAQGPWWMPVPVAPWTVPLIAAGLSIPPLLALYFLKLRRRQFAVSSTLLWRRAVQDLQVNAPFQRLRKSLLFLLQLLILLAAILALWRPTLHVEKRPEKTLILLVDQSASMNTREADGRTRLEHAKQKAKQLIDRMRDDDRAMIIAFNDRARIIAPFSDDEAALKHRIDLIQPTQGLTRLREAFQLAEAYATPIGEGIGTPENPIAPAHVVLFSDGRIEDADQAVLRRGSVELILVGQRSDNFAITAMDVRRHYEEPDLLTVTVSVTNFSDRSATADVALSIDGELVSVQEVAWPISVLDWLGRQPSQDPTAAHLAQLVQEATAAGDLPANAGPLAVRAYLRERIGQVPQATADLLDRIQQEATRLVVFEQVAHPGGGVLEVRLAGRDGLDADNRASAVLEPARRISVLLVSKGNYFLEQALRALPLGALERMSPAQYESADASKLVVQGRCKYDVVIFDEHNTARLPRGAYLFFGAIPRIEGVGLAGFVEGESLVDWDESHPILRHVLLDYVHVLKWARLQLPERAETLIEGQSSPVVSYLAGDGRQYLLVAFSLLDEARSGLNTNWPLRPSFPVFMYNAMRFLSASLGTGAARSLKPGETITVPVGPEVRSLAVRRPDGSKDTVPVRGTAWAHYGRTHQVGLYRVEPPGPPEGLFAVNLFDETESNIRPNPALVLGSGQVLVIPAGRRRVSQPLWPWLLGFALLVLLVEWYVYNRRVLI